MQQSDYDTFTALLQEAKEYYRDSMPLSEARIAIYWQGLMSYPFDRVSRAFVALVQTRKYDGLPKVADIVEHLTPEWKPPEKHQPMTFAELEGVSARARFTVYLVESGKWREVSDEGGTNGYTPNARKWQGAFEKWMAAGQPKPDVRADRGILKGMGDRP